MKTPVVSILFVLWAGALTAGIFSLEKYAITPGPAAAAPRDWPADSQIQRVHHRDFQLVMFLHPKCPCSRASLEELNRVLSRYGGRIDTHVVMVIPAGFDDAWAHSDLYRTAAALEDVTTHLDPVGTEASRFKAKTSGQVMLYGQDGRLLFEGGITGARGHAGDNQGRGLLELQLDAPDPELKRSFVFGCALLSDHEPADGSST